MTLVCFSNTASLWMNSRRRKYEESEAIVCLSSRVSEESIVTIARVGGQRHKSLTTEERAGRLIQDRAEDLRFCRATKGVYQSTDSLYRCIIGMRRAAEC